MTGNPEDIRGKLMKLFDGEAALLSEFETHTELASRFLSGGDADSFIASLDKRQEIIERFNGLHQETDALMQSYMSVPGADGELDARRGDIAGALERLLKRDGEIVAAVEAVAAEYSGEIRKLSDGRRGLGGYIYAEAGHSGLFDKKT